MVNVLLTVVFVIVCVLLILLVLVQDDGQNGMGGIFGGRGTQAFGSHSASILTKTTRVLVILFFVLALVLAFLSKGEKVKTADEIAESVQPIEQQSEIKTDVAPAVEELSQESNQ
ncbi:MAG: preprotein translocase subunit SecG [Spirochaetia bacterium]|nr:preprotein translocase subunit SecG [Spirochaetia bacterium]